MRAKRLVEGQIISILKEAEAGLVAKDIWLQHGIIENTFYHWCRKYGEEATSQERGP